MSNAFDGAGKPFRDPSLRAAVTLMLLILLAVAGVWLAYSWALKEADKQGINTQVTEEQQQSP